MSRLETMLEALSQTREAYTEACLGLVNQMFSSEMKVCAGSCNKILFPRTDWGYIPERFRRKMKEWFSPYYAVERCVTCYRSDVRSEKISPVSRSARVLDKEELEYLRRIAKG